MNDAGERAVKAVQETVKQTHQEKKLQEMLILKGKLKKATARTKATNREAADDLSPTEKVVVVYDLVDLGRHKMELSFVG